MSTEKKKISYIWQQQNILNRRLFSFDIFFIIYHVYITFLYIRLISSFLSCKNERKKKIESEEATFTFTRNCCYGNVCIIFLRVEGDFDVQLLRKIVATIEKIVETIAVGFQKNEFHTISHVMRLVQKFIKIVFIKCTTIKSFTI